MKISFKKELPTIILVALPFIYLACIWNDLPRKVPIHWNWKGEVDRYGDKAELILIPILLPMLVYIIFLIVPHIDPKDKIKNMGNKYQSIKVVLTAFMSFLALFILYSAKNESIANPNYIVLFIGILYTLLGNYFKTIKANYFIGIRTPWTLENELIWKKTHQLGGKLWFLGGIIIVVFSLMLNSQSNFILFFTTTGIIVIFPIVYSYLLFRNMKRG